MQVKILYFPVDFIVLDTSPGMRGQNHDPIILGRPFLTTANALINCRNSRMQITFKDMTLELNIFNLGKKMEPLKEDKPRNTNAIETLVGESYSNLIIEEIS